MKCVTPMFRTFLKKDPSVGHVISRERAMQAYEWDPNHYKHTKSKNNSKYSKWDIQKIPCRKCWACQLNYSAEWATRILLEAKETPGFNFFITLTYDDLHLPIAEKIETEDEVYYNDGTWGGTIYEDHVYTFINSIRQKFHRKPYNYDGIKYFFCSEYGETTGRPHYHVILLHCPIDIRYFYDCHVDTNFKAHWKSTELEKYWDKGIIDVAELEWSCAAYVARYCTKKISYDKDPSVYFKQGKMPERIHMSKGIGFKWYQEHKDEIYKNDEIIMRTVKGNVGSAKPPKAFDRKFKEHDPEGFELIKQSRQTAAERAEKLLGSITDRTEYENLILEAEKVKRKMQMLPRVGEY
jgi:hypothetical protein